MKSLMKRCSACYTYTFQSECPRCGTATQIPIPCRFSPEDRHGYYRRKLKKVIGDYGEHSN